jgi:hypothetical protein
MATRKPSLGLSINVTKPDGSSTRFGSDSRDPRMIPRAISFSSQRMSGWTTGSFTLNWPIDVECPYIGLLDHVAITWADGATAYEGFVAATPRSFDTEHTLTVTLAGHIAKLSRQKCSPIFVDRDLTAFVGEIPAVRRSNVLSGGYLPQGGASVIPDGAGLPGVRHQFDRLANTNPTSVMLIESWYDAGVDTPINKVYADVTTNNGTGAAMAAPWVIARTLCTNDAAEGFEGGSVSSTYSGYYTATGTKQRYLLLNAYYQGTFTGDGQWSTTWRKLAVYCTDVPLVGDTDPKGVLASDVIRWLATRYAPELSTAGIQPTSTPISHLAIRDRTLPYEIALRVNAQHLWYLACWDDMTLHYAPVSLDDWDYEIRHDEVGNTIGLQGDSTEDFATGIEVTFTNVETGLPELLTPDDYPQLRDASLNNPGNTHGEQWHTDYQLSWPSTRPTALEIGAGALAEYNAPKAPGQFTVKGHIRDRQGNLQPAGKVRAHDRIRLTSSVNLSNRPRIIGEIGYDDESKTATITVDSTARVLSAVIDRVDTDLRAAGLVS